MLRDLVNVTNHLFYFVDSDGEILAPLVDVVHQAQGQILERH